MGTQTEKEAVGADATKRTKKLFWKPKQLALVKSVHVCTVDPLVEPHKPLKSQIAGAAEHAELEESVV